MMMKRIVLLLAIMVSYIMAEPPMQQGNVKGSIYDAESQEALAGVNVLILNTNIGIASDVNGEFVFHNIKTGKTILSVSMIGYKPQKIEVEVKADELTEIEVSMEKTLLTMGSVVVTGTGTPHLLEDAPVKTNLVTRLAIEQKKAVNLAEALDFQPGVNVENDCQNCNFSQVRILGMDGKYSQVLIDGDPVVSSLAGVYGLEQFPSEMLERLEIIKGGGSALYGGGAVAGVINLITRRPIVDQTRINISNSIIDNSSNDIHVGLSTEMVSSKGNSGAYIFASARKREHYDRNDDNYSELGDLQNESLGFNWFYSPIKEGELSTHLHRIHETRRGGNKFSLPYHDADIAEALEHWKWGGTVKWQHRMNALFDYKLYYSFALTDRKSYYGGLGEGTTHADTVAALGAYGTTKNPLQVFGVSANYMLGNHLISNGLQFSQDKVEDKSTSNALYYIDEKFTNIGYYIQDNMHLGSEKQLELVVGARVDKHSELDDLIISPRLNVKYNLTDKYVIRAGYSTGFKAPQTYDEDLHICGLGGEQKVIRNSSDLKEETSQSMTASLDYNGYVGNVGVMYGVTGYYTKITDVFTEEFVRSETGLDLWERVNGSGATITGLELELGLQPTSKIEIVGGLSLSEGKYEDELEDWGTKNFLRTPKISGNISVESKITKALSVNLRAKFMGKADVPHEIAVEGQDEPDMKLEESESYTRLDLMVNYKLLMLKDFNTTFTFGVRNITDTYQNDLDAGVDRDPAYVYGPSLPRTLMFSLETNF